MTNILLSGAAGRMGKVITQIAKDADDVNIVCGVDIASYDAGYPIYNDYNDIKEKADVIIDFSHPSNYESVMNYAKENNIPIVVCTTGLTDSQRDILNTVSQAVPVFFSANMSLGINLLIRLAKQAAKVLENKFDIEILEKHHNKKLDAPSGTALAIADGISSVLSEKTEYVYDRQSVRQQREKNEIGICAIRGGTIVGEHDVFFCGPDEILTLSHTATSREIFAQGALSAAKFLNGKPAALYSMDDMFNEIM